MLNPGVSFHRIEEITIEHEKRLDYELVSISFKGENDQGRIDLFLAEKNKVKWPKLKGIGGKISKIFISRPKLEDLEK